MGRNALVLILCFATSFAFAGFHFFQGRSVTPPVPVEAHPPLANKGAPPAQPALGNYKGLNIGKILGEAPNCDGGKGYLPATKLNPGYQCGNYAHGLFWHAKTNGLNAHLFFFGCEKGTPDFQHAAVVIETDLPGKGPGHRFCVVEPQWVDRGLPIDPTMVCWQQGSPNPTLPPVNDANFWNTLQLRYDTYRACIAAGLPSYRGTGIYARLPPWAINRGPAK